MDGSFLSIPRVNLRSLSALRIFLTWSQLCPLNDSKKAGRLTLTGSGASLILILLLLLELPVLPTLPPEAILFSFARRLLLIASSLAFEASRSALLEARIGGPSVGG